MSGGMRLDNDDIRALPLHMQEQVAMAFVAQPAKANLVAGREETKEEKRVMKCDPRVFARCPYNKTCIAPDKTDFKEGSDCFVFNKRILENPVTNADRIRGMSDMELATFMHTATRACADRNCEACPIGSENCGVMLHWLKQREMEGPNGRKQAKADAMPI